MAARDYQATLARLRQLLSKTGSRELSRPTAIPRRATLHEAAAELGLPKSTLHDMAVRHNVPRRRRAMSAVKNRTLEQALKHGEYTLSKISRLLQLSKSTVSVRCRRMIDNDPRARITFRPRQVKTAWRCPEHGLINTDQCIACAALGIETKRATT
jgi:hypothetical protein